MPTIQAKDLTKDHPRSPYEELGGIPWLARLIDKVRALNAGMIGEYVPYPCGGDQNFIKTMGLDTDALKAEITSGKSDEQIVEWVKQHAQPGWQQRLEDYRKAQRSPVSGEMAGYLEGSKQELKKTHPNLDLSKADNWSRLICVEEGHPLP